MDDPITGPAGILVGILNLREAWKMRKLLEANAKSKSAAKPRRKAKPKKRLSEAAMAAIEERRRERLKLERDKHEWRKNRDIANAAKWFIERMSAEDYDD